MRRCTQCQIDYPDALDFCPRDGNRLPPLAGGTQALYDPLIGATIDGRYVIESVLGEGGMGMVYAGRHAIIDKRVAIKVLRKEAAADESSAHRFLAEAKAASKIGHQNIVDITDFGVLPDGHAYFVMEFLDGPTLGKAMSKAGPLPPARAVAIAIQVSRGLSAAHQKGIVHRDLKPENIFVLERDGVLDVVKIVDFGIARDSSTKKRLTVAGMVMGTPEYMAPEQASGQDTDQRADQYALGCILYEMLTGQVPFRGENPMQTLTKHVFGAVVPPSKARPDLLVPPALEAVVMKTLAKKRDDRYPNLEALMPALAALEPALRGIQVPHGAHDDPSDGAVDTSPSSSMSSLELEVPRRRPALFVAGAAAGIVVAGLLAFALRQQAAPPLKPVVAPVAEVIPTTPPIAGELPGPSHLAPETVEVTINSTPPGAEVLFKDELVGVTPAKVTRPHSDTEPVSFVLRKPGYKEATREVMATKDAYVEVLLLRDPTGTKKSAAGTDAAKKTAVTVATRPIAAAGGKNTNVVKTPPPTAPKRTSSELRNPFDDPKP